MCQATCRKTADCRSSTEGSRVVVPDQGGGLRKASMRGAAIGLERSRPESSAPWQPIASEYLLVKGAWISRMSCTQDALERVCCLLVLNLVSSTLPCGEVPGLNGLQATCVVVVSKTSCKDRNHRILRGVIAPHQDFFFLQNHDFSRFLINFSTVVVVKHTYVVDPKRLTHIHSHRDLNSLSLSTESTYLLVPMQ